MVNPNLSKSSSYDSELELEVPIGHFHFSVFNPLE